MLGWIRVLFKSVLMFWNVVDLWRCLDSVRRISPSVYAAVWSTNPQEPYPQILLTITLCRLYNFRVVATLTATYAAMAWIHNFKGDGYQTLNETRGSGECTS